ncbi:GH16880 [Drosophila grimshawi]|uniref:GH16880 n=1 Tax=Drosophila grimshawi TaxID=7222 RepID=B4IXC2_DROGR|nr:GH16880 [Drosophila grimshawi]
MDIPSSGAIFTLGKSHLAENTQSYFYIKNDPVKRLISGPHQSAVICESGRLFVWGENHYGQLGIGGHGNKNNSNNNNSNNNNGDIVNKPTCVKSLKTLGLKISDAAFGNNWAVIMTLSNEIFFTGRNIFPTDTHVAQHFVDAVVEQQPCAIIRKPFRLEEFDDYLSKNEETDNFIALQAGNEHFVVLTTKGRLIGCGSNSQQQLGDLEEDYDGHPVEIRLDALVQQFACGPQSTLVLTATGNLFLTGRLNEFVFPKFTELQKNLSQSEQIIFMHISKASEIFIVTNVGNIYRSFESLRNKSLVFQRFYDYDSEENGPIWKMVKGFSFYAVLSKANKFFTTFSESGHHLKTFREISKFKNLRLLDIAVGDQHILVQGLPRSSNMSATVGTPMEPHSYMSRSFVLQPKDLNGNTELRGASGKSLTKQKALKEPETEPETEAEPEGQPEPKPETGKGLNAMGAGVAVATAGVATLEAVKHMSKEYEADPEPDPEPENKPPSEQEEKLQTENINNNVEKADIEGIKTMEEAVEDVNGNTEMEELKNSKVEPEIIKESVPIAAATSEAMIEPDATEQVEPSAPPESPETQQQTTADTDTNIARLPTPPVESPSPQKSPTESLGSSKFPSQEKLPSQGSQEKQLRPHTPYPESSNTSTPHTIKRTPIRNFSYEAAMRHDEIERTSPELVDSLDTVEENPLAESVHRQEIHISTPTPPTEEDEQLAVEITTTEDALDSSKVVNEIRFINNGIDVTAKVEEQMPNTPPETLADAVEDLESEGEQMLQEMEQHVDKVVSAQKTEAESVGNAIESKLLETRNSVQTTMQKAATGARDAVEAAGDRMATGARDAVDAAGTGMSRMADGVRDTVDGAGKGMFRMADGVRDTVDGAGQGLFRMADGVRDTVDGAGKGMLRMADGVRDTVDGAGQGLFRMADGVRDTVDGAGRSVAKAAASTKESMGKAMDSMTSKISSEMHGAKENLSSLFQIKAAKEQKQGTTTPTTTPVREETAAAQKRTNETTAASDEGDGEGEGEEDERTTASVNSNHNSAGRNGNGNIFEPMNSNSHAFDDDPLDAVVERGKKAMQEELRALEEQRNQAQGSTNNKQPNQQRRQSTDSKGIVQQFLDGMRLSCRNEKAVQIEDEPQPPHYSKNKVDSELSLQNGQNAAQQQSSRVCTIL